MTKRSAKNTGCLWYNDDAEEAAQFYAKTVPDPAVAKRAFDAMMEMSTINIAAIEAAQKGDCHANDETQ
jgi:predicted 3-demethylubiquinone-9 3-methyltransferase (glyoxalase superfamily)